MNSGFYGLSFTPKDNDTLRRVSESDNFKYTSVSVWAQQREREQ